MSAEQTSQGVQAGSTNSLKNACVGCWQKVLAQIARTKTAMFEEWRGGLRRQEQLLRLALNEAEAAAWQTGFPQLVFPTLALEKVQNVAAWERHQRAVQQRSSRLGWL